MLSKLIENFFTFISARPSQEQREHRLQMRWIKRRLARSRTDLYILRNKMAAVPMAQLLFSIYKEVWFLQDSLHRAKTSRRLQAIVVWAHLSHEQRRFYTEAQPAHIVRLVKERSAQAVITTVHKNLRMFRASFDPLKRRNIDGQFCQVYDFIKLATFDYFYLLRRFDPLMPEHIHSYRPKFRSIAGHSVTNLLKDFLEVSQPIAMFNEQRIALIGNILNEYAGAEIIVITRWQKLIATIATLVHSGILLSIIRHIDGASSYESPFQPTNQKIVADFLNWFQASTAQNISIALAEKRNAQISRFITKIFGKGHSERLHGAGSRVPIQAELASSVHFEELKYLQRFLTGPFKKEIFDFIQKTFIVQASWRSRFEYRNFSQLIYHLQELSPKIATADEYHRGLRSQRYESPDARAARLLQSGQQMIWAILRFLKHILDEFVHKRNYIIVNWKELVLKADFALPSQLFQTYKRMHHLLDLLLLLRSYNNSARNSHTNTSPIHTSDTNNRAA